LKRWERLREVEEVREFEGMREVKNVTKKSKNQNTYAKKNTEEEFPVDLPAVDKSKKIKRKDRASKSRNEQKVNKSITRDSSDSEHAEMNISQRVNEERKE
jgi:hypothetical protein